MPEYTMIITKGEQQGTIRDMERAMAFVRGIGQPKAEVVQAFPGAGVIVLKVPGHTDYGNYQPLTYQLYTVNRVVSTKELICTMLAEFEGRGFELYDRLTQLSWKPITKEN